MKWKRWRPLFYSPLRLFQNTVISDSSHMGSMCSSVHHFSILGTYSFRWASMSFLFRCFQKLFAFPVKRMWLQHRYYFSRSYCLISRFKQCLELVVLPAGQTLRLLHLMRIIGTAFYIHYMVSLCRFIRPLEEVESTLTNIIEDIVRDPFPDVVRLYPPPSPKYFIFNNFRPANELREELESRFQLLSR